MIFNKNDKGSEELRVLTGAYYKSNDFEKASVKVMLSSEELAAFIGQAIFDVAETHYKSANYQQPDPEPVPDGSTSGSAGAGVPARTFALLDQLVQHIQLPIAFQATLWHYQGNDISHEDSGRKMKIDADSEKMAWEWMYDRDDAAALRMHQKALDRLIKFLNTNADSFPEWQDSAARKKSLSLFINTSEHFDSLFAIDSSPAFFHRLAPIMAEIERKHIKPIIGVDKFKELKEAIQSAEGIAETDEELYDYICDPIPLMTMSMAVKRFSLTVIPEGVVQYFISQFQTAKANQPVALEQIKYVSKDLWADALHVLNELKKYWSAINVVESEETIDDMLPSMDDDDKFISL